MSVERNPDSESALSAREYIQYKSAVQDFALSVAFATNVLYGNPFKAVTTRPFEVPLTVKDVEGHLAIKETETALTDEFFKYKSLFHSLLGHHDTARTWAQHISWPFTRFNALIVVAQSEKDIGKTTKETIQSARESLDQVPLVDSLKPKLAMAWAHLAPFAQDIDKQPAVCIDTARFILGSLHQEITAFPEDDMRYQDIKVSSLCSSMTKAYLAVAEAEGNLGLNFQMSLRLAQEYADKVYDTEGSIDLLLRSALVKRNLGAAFADDIDKAKGIVLKQWDWGYKHETLLGYLLTIAETELAAVSNTDQTLDLGRELSVTNSKPKESFWGLIQIAQFEKRKGLDATHTLNLARQAKQRLNKSEWDYAEKAIAQAEQMGMEYNSVPQEEYFEIVGRIRKGFTNAKEPWKKFLYARDLITTQVANGFYPPRSFEEAEVLASSLDAPLQAQYLLDLAELAAKAGLDPRYYTDKARHLVYQKMIKGYKTDEVFQKITKAEIEIGRTLISRCYPTLIRLGRTEMEQLATEAIRLNDKDCLRALGAFLPLDIQAKYASQETEPFFLAGRAMRGIC